MLRENEIRGGSGWVALFALLLIAGLSIWGMIEAGRAHSGLLFVACLLAMVVSLVSLAGLTVVNPNSAKVVTLFGLYKGTNKEPGYWWMNPLTTRRGLSLRVRNFESGRLKVNDRDGNPVDIASVVVWRIVDTCEAVFNVDDYEHFVHVQSEAAVRILATTYAYDAHEDGQLSLRSSVDEISDRLRAEIQGRLSKAGIDVIESRISHLAYAPEIAGAMLRRQQASAVIAARQKIVEGAVGMVQMALDQLSQKHVVDLDEERKASMVSNLLVVLCSDRDAQPIVNAGTLYQ